ncbi:unnamed protein product, partial [Symbiodinium pilosum]
MPRTPPSGLLSAVKRAAAIPVAMSGGTSALANWDAASASNSMASTSCNNSLRCSALMPDRPAAPPRCVSRSADATAPVANLIGCWGWCCRTSSGISRRSSGGRRGGFRAGCYFGSREDLACSEHFPLAHLGTGASALTFAGAIPLRLVPGRRLLGSLAGRPKQLWPLASLEL